MAALLQALARYQKADRGFKRPMGAALLHHGTTVLRSAADMFRFDTGGKGLPRIIFVPSPINAPNVLDMDGDCSLMAWLSGHGLASALVDWGAIGPEHRHETVDSYALARLLPLLRQMDGPVHLVGYCLGGLIAMATACHIPVQSLTLIATPWHFSGYAVDRRAELGRMWESHKPSCAQMGMVPMEVMQHGFWTLSPEKLIEKYLGFGQIEPDSPKARRFVAVEDWANGGEPLPYALGEQLFEQFYQADITGTGRWHVGGKQVCTANVQGPAMEFASASDAIVPLSCSPDIPGRRVLESGHVGMMVGSSAPRTLWPMLKQWILANDAPR